MTRTWTNRLLAAGKWVNENPLWQLLFNTLLYTTIAAIHVAKFVLVVAGFLFYLMVKAR
ncbi:MAG: hypothetical protein ACFHX7_08030 [Pseudomonadota bacterium]